jgi:hypothetical protein
MAARWRNGIAELRRRKAFFPQLTAVSAQDFVLR